MLTSAASFAPNPSIALCNCNVSLLNYPWLFFPFIFPKAKGKWLEERRGPLLIVTPNSFNKEWGAGKHLGLFMHRLEAAFIHNHALLK